MPIYLKLDELAGETTIKGFEKHITIKELEFGGGCGIDTTSPGWSAGSVSLSEITMKKNYDAASPVFFQNMCAGKHFTKGTIQITKQSTSTTTANEPFITMTLDHVFVSGQSVTTSGDRPEESVTMAFKKITIKYMTQKEDGSMVAEAPEVSWDLTKNVG